MSNTKEILTQFANQLVSDIKDKIPVATGATQDSIRYELTRNSLTVYAGAQLSAIIEGRKPTRPGAKNQGGPTLQQMILVWIRAKNIRPREAKMSELSLSYAISKSIHENGYPGRGNILATVITKNRFTSLASILAKDKIQEIQSDILSNFDLQ